MSVQFIDLSEKMKQSLRFLSHYFLQAKAVIKFGNLFYNSISNFQMLPDRIYIDSFSMPIQNTFMCNALYFLRKYV